MPCLEKRNDVWAASRVPLRSVAAKSAMYPPLSAGGTASPRRISTPGPARLSERPRDSSRHRPRQGTCFLRRSKAAPGLPWRDQGRTRPQSRNARLRSLYPDIQYGRCSGSKAKGLFPGRTEHALSRQPTLRRRHCHRSPSAPVRHVGSDRPGRGRRPALELLVRKPVPRRPEGYRQGRRGRKLIGSQGAVVRHADAVSVRMSSGRPGRQGRSSASAPGTSKLNPEA